MYMAGVANEVNMIDFNKKLTRHRVSYVLSSRPRAYIRTTVHATSIVV